MSLTKVVNGQIVPLTTEEEADVRARWAANEAVQPEKTLDQKLDAIIDTLPLGVQIQFAPLLSAGMLFIQTKRMDRLRALIESATVPPQLEPVKQQLLAEIPE